MTTAINLYYLLQILVGCVFCVFVFNVVQYIVYGDEMRCIYCDGKTRVIDKRDGDGFVRRRRLCLKCGRRFTTYERPASIIKVRKRSGRMDDFSREKIVSGLLKAMGKGEKERAEKIAEMIETRVRKKGTASTREIGRWILNILRKTDKIAYIRFASVYKSPEDVGDIEQIIKEVRK